MILSELIRRSLAAHAERPAIIDGSSTYTFAEVSERSHRLVNALRSLGIEKDDRVATLSPNSVTTLEEILGLALGGYARAALHAMNSGPAHRQMLEAAGARALITTAEFYERFKSDLDAVPSLDVILVHGAHDESQLDYETVLALASPHDALVEVSGDTISHLAYSSGTSGTPRASVHTQASWVFVAADNAGFLPRMSDSDVYLAVAPLTHAASTVLFALLHAGASVRIMDHFEPGGALAIVESEKVTSTVMVPTMLRMLAEHPDARTRDLSSLRWILYAGAPISPETAALAQDVFGSVLFQTYGQSECLPATVLTPEDHERGSHGNPSLLRSAGRPILTSSVKILTADDALAGIGELGEIAVKANGRMVGIYGDPAATAARFTPDGFVRTNDIGYLDPDGYLYVVDRKDDMIISGGFNIWPAEIESVLVTHDAVDEAAVFGIPHAKWGETPVAVVVIHDGASVTEADLIEVCRRSIGSMKKPSSIVLRTEPLPRNQLGKLERRALREQYWSASSVERQVSGA
ncbi:MAG: hypothetical protein JWQ64_3877 [Subtercola sp.]|nr:hypothetical protein [Subtercola sp.]